MHEDLDLNYRRWRNADELVDPDGDRRSDEDADAAFGAVFQACTSAPLPSAQFTSNTMAAIAATAAADARRARVARAVLLWSGLPAGAVVVYFGAGALLSALSSALVGALNLLVAIVVWFANGPDVRSGAWTLLTGMGRAAAAFVADPRVTIAMLVFQVIAVAALVALHRLLGPEREWLK
jgi:hypothetical protein